jgi:hypothetical protein
VSASIVAACVTPAAFAAALLLASGPGVGHAAPQTCADVLKAIEKRLADAGVAHPPLKIVPKNLASGYQVVGTCEGGTQRVVHDIVPGTPVQGTGTKKGRPGSATAKP